MAEETVQTESETTQQPLYRVRARHVLLSSDPPEESEPLPVARYEQPSAQTQLDNGAVSLPGPHPSTSSLPESTSLINPSFTYGNGSAEPQEQAMGREGNQKRADKADSSPQSQLFQQHATWRTSLTPPPPSSPDLRTSQGDKEDEIDQLKSSSLAPVVSEAVDDAPEVPDPVDPPGDTAPFVESPPESTSPKPFPEIRRSARTTPRKTAPGASPALDTNRKPITTFTPSPMKGKMAYTRQSSVPATAAQHHSPFNKAPRVFGRTRSDKAPIAEEDVEQDSFTNDRFLNPRQRVEKLERESRRPARARHASPTGSKSSIAAVVEEAEATDTEEQHDSHFVSQSLKQIEVAGDVEEEDIDAAFAEMDRLQPTYKDSSPILQGNDRSSESPTPQRVSSSRAAAPDDSLEESSNRDLFAESAVQPNVRLQRFDMPSSAESSRFNPLSQLATTSEKGFGAVEDSQMERTFPATQFAVRSPSKAASSPDKQPADSSNKSNEIDPTQITTSPAVDPTDPPRAAGSTPRSPGIHSHAETTASAGVSAILPTISASRQLTRSRPNSISTAQSGQNGSLASLHGAHASPSGSAGTTGGNTSSGAPSSRLTASRMLRRKSDKAPDPDAALYSARPRSGRSATPGNVSRAKSLTLQGTGAVEATQVGTQLGPRPADEMATAARDVGADGGASASPVQAAVHPHTRASPERRNRQAKGGLSPHNQAAIGHVSGNPRAQPRISHGFEPTFTDESAHGSTTPRQQVSMSDDTQRDRSPLQAVFPLIDRLRAPSQPEASSLFTPLPSSSPSRPLRSRRSSPTSGPAFRAALLGSSPPRDVPAVDDVASDDPASKPSDKIRTLEIPPAKPSPKRQYGKRPARERKQTARAKEGQAQEKSRKAKKAEARKAPGPNNNGEAAGDGGTVEAEKGEARVKGDDDDVSSATTASDPEDETFRMTPVQNGSRKQKRSRISSEVRPIVRTAREVASKQDGGESRTEDARSAKLTPSGPFADKGGIIDDDADDGYISPETPIDMEDHTFRPNATGKRKREGLDRPNSAGRGPGTSTRGSSSTAERAPKRRKRGRVSRGSANRGLDDDLTPANHGPVTPNRATDDVNKAKTNGSVAARRSGSGSKVPTATSTPVPRPRIAVASTPLSSLPGGQSAGMRVLAHWASGQWFVGTTVEQVDGDKIAIDFDDKTRAKVSARQLRRFELRQGDQVGSIRPPRESGVVNQNYVDDGRAVQIVGGNGKRKKVPIASVFVTTANVTKQWDDRLPDHVALGLASPLVPAVSRVDTIQKEAPFQSMRFLLTIDEDARKNTTKDDLKGRIVGGGGAVIEDWRELFDLPEGGFGSTFASGGPIFCVVHGAQSTKPKALVALAAGIPCVASEWVHDASVGRHVDWRSYLVCAGHAESLNRDVSQVIEPKYGMGDWRAGQARNPRQPFEGKRVLFVSPKDTDFEPVKRLVPVCLHALGASSVKQVSMASASEDLAVYDYVLLESRDAAFKQSKLPKAWQTCDRLVNTGWLKQCIIMGAALQPLGLD